jgi:hypothetical protein
MLEPSWRDDIVVVVSLPLGVVAAPDKELARPVTSEAESERHVVWSTRHGTRCTEGARFLGCTRLQVTTDSPLRRDGQFVCHVGLNPGFGWRPTSSLRDDRVRVPRLNALKFLQWGCKNDGRGRRSRARRRAT